MAGMDGSFNSAEWCVLIRRPSTTDTSYWILFGSDIRPAEKESTMYSLSWTELCKLIRWIINVHNTSVIIFFRHFIFFYLAWHSFYMPPKSQRSPCSHVNSPFLQRGQVEHWTGKRKSRILKAFLCQMCPMCSFCSTSFGLWATGGSSNQERSLLITSQMFAVQGIIKRPSQPWDAGSP